MFSNIKLVGILIVVSVIAFSIMSKSPSDKSSLPATSSSEPLPMEEFLDSQSYEDTSSSANVESTELPQASPELPASQLDEPPVYDQRKTESLAAEQSAKIPTQPPSEDLTGLYCLNQTASRLCSH